MAAAVSAWNGARVRHLRRFTQRSHREAGPAPRRNKKILRAHVTRRHADVGDISCNHEKETTRISSTRGHVCCVVTETALPAHWSAHPRLYSALRQSARTPPRCSAGPPTRTAGRAFARRRRCVPLRLVFHPPLLPAPRELGPRPPPVPSPRTHPR